MSTEQEISGAEREAMKTGKARIPNLSPQSRGFAHAGYNDGWNSAKEYFHNSIVEQRQRADMAEEREKALRDGLMAVMATQAITSERAKKLIKVAHRLGALSEYKGNLDA